MALLGHNLTQGNQMSFHQPRGVELCWVFVYFFPLLSLLNAISGFFLYQYFLVLVFSFFTPVTSDISRSVPPSSSSSFPPYLLGLPILFSFPTPLLCLLSHIFHLRMPLNSPRQHLAKPLMPFPKTFLFPPPSR